MAILTVTQTAPIVASINKLRARLFAATENLNAKDIVNAQCNVNGANWEVSMILHAINELEGRFGVTS